MMYITKLVKLGIGVFRKAKSEGESNESAISKVLELVEKEMPNISFELRPVDDSTYYLTNKIDRNKRWSDTHLYYYILQEILGYFIRVYQLSYLDVKNHVGIRK